MVIGCGRDSGHERLQNAWARGRHSESTGGSRARQWPIRLGRYRAV